MPPARSASTSAPAALRFASYNTSLYADNAGGLIARLRAGDANASKIAAVLQHVRPDVVLLNEFDFDADATAAQLFQSRYLQISQHGGTPIYYPHMYYAPVNTGVASGLDLDNDGVIGEQGRAYAQDAWGYGLHPGQYGMLVLSMYPIDSAQVRTFQHFRWAQLPGARQPVDPTTKQPWYAPAIWQQLRLSSKSHWDVPIHTPQGIIHFLVSHPTPPVFDGDEDRNGARNHDEIRLWAEYISGQPAPWLCDDRGQCGGLDTNAAFVIAGDLNADPDDGDSTADAAKQLTTHAQVLQHTPPASAGAVARARHYGLPRRGNSAHHTGDFGPRTGTLRIDYVLPSRHLRIADSGVFWPLPNTPHARFSDASDHHLVWIDVLMGD